MTRENVRTPEDALNYLVNCQLATVSYMASKKSRPRGEYKRQIVIAQTGVDWLVKMEIPIWKGRRANDVLECQGRVAEWAKQFEPEQQE